MRESFAEQLSGAQDDFAQSEGHVADDDRDGGGQDRGPYFAFVDDGLPKTTETRSITNLSRRRGGGGLATEDITDMYSDSSVEEVDRAGSGQDLDKSSFGAASANRSQRPPRSKNLSAQKHADGDPLSALVDNLESQSQVDAERNDGLDSLWG